MDALPAAAPTAAMQMMAATKGGAVAPSAANPSGWTPPAGSQVNMVPTIDVGGTPGAPAGQPGSELAPAPPPAVGAKSGASWMDAIPAAQPTAAMQMAAGHGGNPHDAGLLANIGAGTSSQVADTLGLPVDAATGALNLIPRGINAVAGTHIPTIQNPVGGSTWLKSEFGRIGADPRTVVPQNELERIARAGGSGAASMLLPWGAANALPELAGIPGAAQGMFGAGGAPTMTAAGFTGGAAGQEAQDSAPAPFKPLANLAGNVIGGGIPLAGKAAFDAVAPAAGELAGHYLQPVRAGTATGTLGRALDRVAGGGREMAAAQRIAKAATDVGGVRDTLQAAAAADQEAGPLEAAVADPATPPAAKAAAQQRLAELAAQRTQIVPGSAPTTYQLTGDQGLGNLERVTAKENPDAFIARRAEQNAAQVGQIEGQAPATASPQAVVTSFRGQLAALDAQQAAGAAADQQAVRSAVEPLGGEPPVGPGAQATALQQYGEKLRDPLVQRMNDSKIRMKALSGAVDPDGTLRVGMAPIREAARAIVKEMPANSTPMAGEEAAIFGRARMLPAVQPFAEAGALRSRITDAMRKELSENGSSQSYRRLTQLLGAVDETMSGGVQDAAEREAAEVAAGTKAPGDTVQARLDALQDGGEAGPTAERSAPLVGEVAAGGANGAAREVGVERAGTGGLGSAGVDSGLAPGATDEVGAEEGPNFDAAAAARYRENLRGWAEHYQRFTDQKTAPGVAQVLKSGARKGEFAAPLSAVPGTLFAPGKGAAERVGAFLKAGGNPAEIKDYLAFSLRSAAEKEDGTLKAPALDRWLRQNRETLDAAGLSPEFDSVAKAQAALDAATARRVAEREAFEASAARHFLGDADPVVSVGRILRSDTAEATMRDLARRTAGDPAARVGLQRAVVEHILGDLRTNTEAGDTGQRMLKADAYQAFVRRSLPALRQIFKPDQVKAIEDVAADIQRTQRSIVGTKLPGGSNTAQDLAAGAKHGGHRPSMVGLLMASEVMGEMGEHIGGPFAKIMGMVVVPITNALRQVGFQTTGDMVAEAMLHPDRARALLAKLPAGGFAKPVVENAVRSVRAIGAAAAAREAMRPAPRKEMKR
jgi:hypothetical protein